ncbi:Fc.00g080700.m01.CDS01 [Cosmosporella sp. VM-42]
MTRQASLKSFLAAARTALSTPASQRKGPLTFVVGNESADLDSLCSALLFAYIRTNTRPHTLHIPLCNLPRPDLALRTEMAAVLRHASLTPKDLITLSDLPELDPKDTRWLLVDHNCLTGVLKKFSGQIIGVVDHHADEGAVHAQAEPRVVQPCGSCMSLIVEESKKVWEESAAQDSDVASEEEKLAKIGLAAILTDTINLTAKEKVRDPDPKAVSFLESKIQDKSFDREKFYEEIAAVKEDISGLNFRDIFRKDYKEWDQAGLKLGISCVVQNFDYLISMAGGKKSLLDDFVSWVKERELDVAAIMTTSNPEGEFQRHLLVWGANEKGEEVLERFVKIGEDKLKLEGWKDGELDDGKKRIAWRQKALAASRKQVAPLLREAMKS